MRYRTRVTLERPTEIRSPKGRVTFELAPITGLADVPATIVPSIDETRQPGQTTIEDRYDVLIAGRHFGLEAKDYVRSSDGRSFEIETIHPLLGERQTSVTARLVTTPVTPAEGS